MKFNIDGTFMHLLAIEDHLRRMSASYETEEASCLMKHLLQLQEQSLEGISHASEVGDKEKVQVFKDMQARAEEIRDELRKRVDPMTLIKEIRELRKRAEVLDPTFNLEKCASCGVVLNDKDDTHALEELEEIASHEADPEPEPDLDTIEEGMGRYVLDRLGRENGVKPPELVINEKCSDPSKATYTKGKITVCRGGANIHVLKHEFKHHQQRLAGRGFDEDEAEHFAESFQTSKVLNSKTAEFTRSDKGKMTAIAKSRMKHVGAIVGVSVVSNVGAKVIGDKVDVAYPTLVLGQPASTIVDAVASSVLVIVALTEKSGKYVEYLALGASGFVSDLITRRLLPLYGLSVAHRVVNRMTPQAVFPSIQPQANGTLFGG